MELIRCEAGHGDLDLARGYLLSVNFPVTEIQNKVNNVNQSWGGQLQLSALCPIQFYQVQTKVETLHLTVI